MNTKPSLKYSALRHSFVMCFLITILYSQMLNNSTIYAKSFSENVTEYEKISEQASEPIPGQASGPLTELNITAPSAVVMDAESNIIVFDKNKDDRNYPASITKIMTALLTLEKYGENLDERIYFSHDAVFTLPYGSSHIAMNDGETLSVEEAMNGLMLPSANDVANALAESVGGTMDNFAAMMTQRAKELSALNTNFTNAHGLHDENHYTTAHDMAMIMQEALKHEDFVRYISTLRYDIPPTEKQRKPRQLVNTNKLIHQGQYFYEYAIGGKTGFTNEAMHTLVTYAEKDGIRLISVVMHDEKAAAYTDTIAMLELAFDSYVTTDLSKLLQNGPVMGTIPVVQTYEENEHETGSVDYGIGESSEIILPSFISAQNVKVEETIAEKITAPVTAGDKLGFVELSYDGRKLGQLDLIAKNSVEFSPLSAPPSVPDEGNNITGISDIMRYLRLILISSCIFVALIMLLLIILIRRRNLRRRRRKNARLNSYRPSLTKMYK